MRCLYWLEEGRLAGSCMPGSLGEVKELAEMGIRRAVVLPEDYEIADFWGDAPSYFEALSLFGIEYLHEPVPDMEPPTIPQLRRIFGWIREGWGKPTLVHCVGGLGRTGTVMAAWLIVERGLGLREALEAVRSLRPGSVQSYSQLLLLSRLASDRRLAALLGEGAGGE